MSSSLSSLPFSAQTPINIASVGLKVRDAAALSSYYRGLLGLVELSNTPGEIVLGTANRPLLHLEEDKALLPDDPRDAGLFHTAFLMPTRRDLARWAYHAHFNSIKIQGASDHLVSEAFYLTDPEGNGIEIYADRPREEWTWQDDKTVEMATLPMNIQSLLAEPDGTEPLATAPDDMVIGHVHLRVGDPAQASQWWQNEMGLVEMAQYGNQAAFLASGGYHHHIGVNSWSSAGAGKRDPHKSGLAWVALNDAAATEESERQDPWGTNIRLKPQMK